MAAHFTHRKFNTTDWAKGRTMLHMQWRRPAGKITGKKAQLD